MAEVVQRKGNQLYRYEVTWDPKKKKRVWRYVGKITGAPGPPVGERGPVGLVLSDHEHFILTSILEYLEKAVKFQKMGLKYELPPWGPEAVNVLTGILVPSRSRGFPPLPGPRPGPVIRLR